MDIKLKSFKAESKIKVIKEVRGVTSLGLKEAKELVESAPCTLMTKVKREDALKIVESEWRGLPTRGSSQCNSRFSLPSAFTLPHIFACVLIIPTPNTPFSTLIPTPAELKTEAQAECELV